MNSFFIRSTATPREWEGSPAHDGGLQRVYGYLTDPHVGM